MTEKRKLVMATNNAGKLREARAIAGDRLEILSLKDIGYNHDIPETADTLEGNALIKVRAIKDATGLDCFADDTGLMVDALGGAPGVHTARYAGEDCDPDRNMDLMLRNMEGVTDRHARFCTCVALSFDGEEHVFEGAVDGDIATEKSGSHGFGYDPIFIPRETGICFAEMTDEAKNSISHRSRAISAMMQWLGALCLCLFSFIGAYASSASSDWRLFNTFDDKVDHIFDTPDKTYFLAYAQAYIPSTPDNAEKLMFLFARDKDTDEIRQYNIQNILSRSLIRQANYNSRKRYLLLVYDDYTIDFLYDDGSVKTVSALRNYSGNGSKEIRSISFDPELGRVYLASDFGYLMLDDKKHEVVSSGIYNQPIDGMIRVADKLVILRDHHLYGDNYDNPHLTLSDFKELDWAGTGSSGTLISLTPERCIVSKNSDGNNRYYILSFEKDVENPSVIPVRNLDNTYIVENKEGLLIGQYGYVYQLPWTENEMDHRRTRDEEYAQPLGSWDFRNFHYSRPREGFYTLRYNDDASWTVTSQPIKPNTPAIFRSNNLLYSQHHGVLANTHGINQNFTSRDAANPILLSGIRDQEWTMYGLPYLIDDNTYLRLINPCGIAQDPDYPDVFYFGSAHNGLLRYNIKDGSSLLHFTKSNDTPNYPGHITLQDPYAVWSNTFIVMNPAFDTKGNLLMAHVNTAEKTYTLELWGWTPEDRHATTSPETYRPFTRLPIKDIVPILSNVVLPLTFQSNQDLVVILPTDAYDRPIIVYDHNGTIKQSSDDRQATMKNFEDSDGKLDFHKVFCAIEDPSTGLVWVGSDDGVFTFDPKDAFSNPGMVSRIKVSRNDGTSLADYLLSGTSVNDISIDSQGRKWFSLAGGGLVCTSADGKTIIQEIDTENSLLPSDMVYASCYNPDNNSLMIGTSAGLCEFYLSGQSAEDAASSVRAYPNPVRHDYYGWVTIDGLEEDAIVKIADSAGNIVRELGPASAGKVQWDVCGMDLNRVPTGVYFVLASSGPGSGSYSEATKILVVNR